jgi:hypothetical protein
MVALMTTQLQLYARAACGSFSAARVRQRAPALHQWFLWWSDIVDTFGDVIMQMALFLAVNSRQSVIGFGYLMFTVLFLLRPDHIQRLWFLPNVYAQSVCVLQVLVQFNTVRNLIISVDPACLDDDAPQLLGQLGPQVGGATGGGSSASQCWLTWIGFDSQEVVCVFVCWKYSVECECGVACGDCEGAN